MEKVKLSTLSKDTKVLVEDYDTINSVEDILNDLEYYKAKDIYTTTPHYATFNAKNIIEDAIVDEAVNDMYEDWDENIIQDVKDEDISEIQAVFDRILARSPGQNISYEQAKLIEIDI